MYELRQFAILKKGTTDIIEVLSIGVPNELSTRAKNKYITSQIQTSMTNLGVEGDRHEVPASWEIVKDTNLKDYDTNRILTQKETKGE